MKMITMSLWVFLPQQRIPCPFSKAIAPSVSRILHMKQKITHFTEGALKCCRRGFEQVIIFHLPWLPYINPCPFLHKGNWLIWHSDKWEMVNSISDGVCGVRVCVCHIIIWFLPAPFVFLCKGTLGNVFMSFYLGESTDRATMELILLGMRLGSCCTMLAVVLLFWSVPWSFLLQRDSWLRNMIQTTNYSLVTSQPSPNPSQGLTRNYN